MSGTGRDAGGMNAGTSGSSSMGDRGLGSAEVHTGLHSGSGEGYSGLQFAGSEQGAGAGNRLRDAADAVRDRIPEGVRNLGAKASESTSGVRGRLGGVAEKASGLMESRGMLDRLRENPLPVLGVAFAVGFLLSGGIDDDDDYEPSRASTARRELRSALMAGVTAGIAQGARGFLGEASAEGGSFLNTLLDNVMGGKGGSQGGGTSRAGGTGGSTGGGSYGGSTGGASGGISRTAGRPGGTGASGARPGQYSGGGSTGSRPPSHQEY